MKISSLFCLLLPLQLLAQNETRIVKAEQEMTDVFSTKDIFRYENYEGGKVIFKDGTLAEAKLNYNRFFEQMLFIDGKGDTLTLANPELVDVIVIGKDSFYYVNEFFVDCSPLLYQQNWLPARY